MNYFELHIGDYQRKTAHLSLAEHGAYSLMLQTFYATERPLPVDRKVLYRLLRADSIAERKAIDSIASEFWQTTDTGLTNKRADQVLDAYRAWLAKQKANGSRGGRPPLTQTKPTGSINANPSKTQTEPTGGDRARVPLPTPHLDHDLDTHTHTTPRGAPGGSPGPEPERVCGNFKKAGSGWKPPTDEDLGLKIPEKPHV